MASKAIGFLNFKFGADLGGFERAMNKAQKKLKKFGKGVERTGKSLTTGLTLPIVALGAASLKTFADFEQGMLKVKAISGATESEFIALTESAKKLGSTTMFTASQVAELQLNLSKLGLTPTQINQSTASILNLAQATDSDLGQAATVTAKIMNAFGMEATDMTRITDVMADSFSSTALDMTKFETAMASVAPVAKMAGSDLEKTSAILGVLVNNGVEASTAGTALRNIFLDLAKSGKTWDQAMVEINSSVNPLAVSMDMFGKRGANVATILAQSGLEIQGLTEDFRDSAGEAQKMAILMDSGISGSMRRLQSQAEGAAIELGENLVPIFTIVVRKISKMVEWFTDLNGSQQKNIVRWGLIIAAIGPVLIIFGKLSLGVSALIPIILMVQKAFIALTVTMYANPFIALAGAIVLVIGYFTDWFGLMGETDTALNEVIGSSRKLKELNDSAFDSVSGDIIKIQDLTDVINDENIALEDKEKALNELKKISPQYYNQFATIEGNINAVTLATENYTKALINQSQMEFASGALTDVYADLVMDLGGGVKGMEQLQRIDKGLGLSIDFSDMGGKPEGFNERITLYYDLIDVKKKLIKQSTSFKKAIESKNVEVFGENGETGVIEEDDKPRGGPKKTEVKEDIKAVTLQLEQLKKVANSIPEKVVIPIDKKPVEEYRGALGTLVDQISILTDISAPELEDALMSTMEKLGDNLAQGAESFKEFGESVKGMMRDIIGGIISQGIATAITAALSNPAIKINPFLIPVIAGAAAGLARTAFNSLVPAFAEGGLVTGPTTALIGEGIGTNAGNPEVVAPLDKLKSMMGGGNNNIVVTGKLIGSDIFLSNQNASNNRLRTT